MHYSDVVDKEGFSIVMFGNKKLLKMVEKAFGQNPLEGHLYYNAEKRIDRIGKYHDNLAGLDDSKWVVDDITWNDLEMDRVFLRINHTNSFIGEQTLYHKLHVLNGRTAGGLSNDKSDVEKRLEYYEANTKNRADMEVKLQYIGKMNEGYFLSDFLMNTNEFKLGNPLIYHFLQLMLVVFMILSFIFDNMILLTLGGAVALVNLMIYMSVKQEYEIFFTSLIEFKKIFEFTKWMNKYDKSGTIITADAQKALKELRKMSWVISGMNGRRQASMAGDVLGILREYLWGMLLIDVSMFNYIMRIIDGKQKEVLCLLDFVGGVDSDIAVVSYRKSMDAWCKPEYVSHGMTAEKMAHPLINNPVTNDFNLTDRAVLTGANASGKSTFMKSVAINCILAQSINTCVAETFRTQPLIVMTCMALRDDILTGESYYYREAKCIKRMLDLIVKEDNVLVVIDEILKGTNTEERIAASKAIMDYIAETDCLTLLATHDKELTENGAYKNYHFRNDIKGGDIVFDYLIHTGRSEQSNAIELLTHLEYPSEVVKNARKYLHE